MHDKSNLVQSMETEFNDWIVDIDKYKKMYENIDEKTNPLVKREMRKVVLDLAYRKNKALAVLTSLQNASEDECQKILENGREEWSAARSIFGFIRTVLNSLG